MSIAIPEAITDTSAEPISSPIAPSLACSILATVFSILKKWFKLATIKIPLNIIRKISTEDFFTSKVEFFIRIDILNVQKKSSPLIPLQRGSDTNSIVFVKSLMEMIRSEERRVGKDSKH